MKLKSSNNKGWLKFILLAFGGFLLVSFLLNLPTDKLRAWDTKNNSAPTPDSVLQFMQQEQQFLDVLDFFESYLVFLSVKDDASQNLPQEIRSALVQRGSKKIEGLNFQDSYVAMLKNGKILKEQLRGKSPAVLKYKGVKVYSGGGRVGSFSKFRRYNESTEGDKKGMHVYVQNPDNQDVYLFSFDYHSNKAPRSKGSFGLIKFDNLETISISISEKRFEKLQQKREEALKAQVLLTSDEDFLPANINHRGKDFKGALRLKGDWTDHLDGSKWSFRVKLDKDQSILGMRKFSLHHPKTRNYASEWLFHKLLEQEGILNLQYHFVQVELYVEGEEVEKKYLSIYALEEAFDKYLIERNQKRESVILKLDEDPIWRERAAFFSRGLGFKHLDFSGLIKDHHLSVLPFGETRTLIDSTLSKEFDAARYLFSAYLRGELPVSEVFDVELLAKYNALCNVLGATHALIPHNIRVYYNPITSRLEPIGFDADAGGQIWKIEPFYLSQNDPVFMRAFARELDRMIAPSYTENILEHPEFRELTRLLSQEFPSNQLDFRAVKHNQKIIYHKLYPEKCLNVHLELFEQNQAILSIENFGPLPVEVIGMQKKEGKIFGFSDSTEVVLPSERKNVLLSLDENYRQLFVRKKQKTAQFNIAKDIRDVHLLWKTLGTSAVKQAEILPWSFNTPVQAQSDLLRRKSNVEHFDFMIVDEKAKTITCKPGTWALKNNLIIPEGYTFKAGPGCVINFESYLAKIISYSTVQLIGTEKEPVVFKSDTNQGRGLIVIGASSDTSVLRHCQFVNLSNPGTANWAVTGAINFYETPVRISNTSFLQNRCEDALNIIRGWFEMDSVIFTDIYSDAFDGDFVQGSIKNALFGNLGNDAIDVSGSNISIENVDIVQAGDKGLSAGESSQMWVKNVAISESEIAVASKDKSSIVGENIILRKNRLGFTAYQKKPEFGGSKIDVNGVQFSINELDYLIENGSSLRLDGQPVKTSTQVLERMYGNEFGKESQ